MQVVSIVFSTKEGGMENVAIQKRDSKETVEPDSCPLDNGLQKNCPRTIGARIITPG